MLPFWILLIVGICMEMSDKSEILKLTLSQT